MRKQNNLNANFLEKVAIHNPNINWSANENAEITVEIENKGIFNRIAQKLLKKPKISYIHLDKMGNFIWPLIDGQKNIADIAVFVKEEFGQDAEPLYERLIQYFKTLENYKFIEFKN